MGQSNWVHFENCDIVGATEKALHVEYDGTEFWVPRSVVDGGDKLEQGDKDVSVSIQEWFCEKEGLEP